jgi:TatD DNase family protein
MEYIINVGTDIETSKLSIELANKYEKIYCAVGVHPHDAKDIYDKGLETIKELAKSKKVIGIGEIGLDYYRNISPVEIQKDVFTKQINIANELNLPIIVHDRDAHNDILKILKEQKASKIGGVMHCFSGNIDFAKSVLDIGFYISFAGNITFKKSAFNGVIKFVPIDKIFIETDCPFLTPEPFRGRRNEPLRVQLTAKKISEIKNMDIEKVAEITSKNIKQLFKIS